MRTFGRAAIWRYLSICLQFAVVAVVSRFLSPAETSSYLSGFGVTQAIYVWGGLGLPDGVVQRLAGVTHRHGEAAAGQFLWSAWRRSIVRVSVPAAIGLLLGFCFGWSFTAVVLWSLGYALIFVASQFLVATNRVELAAFSIYSLSTIASAVAALPLALGYISSVEGLMTLTGVLVAGSGIGVVTGVFFYLPRAGSSTCLAAGVREELRQAQRVGLTVVIGRGLMALFIWLPTWASALWVNPDDAARVALSSRIGSGVAALLASIRFSIRAELATLAVREQWDVIAVRCSRVAAVVVALALAAGLGSLLVGDLLVGWVFGESYAPISLVLLMAMLAVAAESVGGPIDEALKMSGDNGFVVTVQAVALLIAATAEALIAIRFGNAVGLYGAHVVATLAIFGSYVVRFRAQRAEWVLPVPVRRK